MRGPRSLQLRQPGAAVRKGRARAEAQGTEQCCAGDATAQATQGCGWEGYGQAAGPRPGEVCTFLEALGASALAAGAAAGSASVSIGVG